MSFIPWKPPKEEWELSLAGFGFMCILMQMLLPAAFTDDRFAIYPEVRLTINIITWACWVASYFIGRIGDDD